MPLIGGALADAVDRRRMVLLAEFLLAAASVVLLVNALLPAPRLWVLFVVGGTDLGVRRACSGRRSTPCCRAWSSATS